MKPLDFPDEGEVRISVRGYKYPTYNGTAEKEENAELEWHVDFPAGYHDPFFVDMEAYARRGTVWVRLRRVEVEARFGVQGLDWEFCMDGLVVAFQEKGEEEGGEEGDGRGQLVLGQR